MKEMYFRYSIVLTATLLSLIKAQSSNNEPTLGSNKASSQCSTSDPSPMYYLYQRPLTSPGIVYAFSAYVCGNNATFNVQLWRPQNVSSGRYYLVADWPVVPTQLYGLQSTLVQNVFGSTMCAWALPNDRLGIYVPGNRPSSVAMAFVGDGTGMYRYIAADSNSPVQLGQTVQFDLLGWPNIFSLVAFIHPDSTNYSSSSVQCPSLQIPTTQVAPSSTTDSHLVYVAYPSWCTWCGDVINPAMILAILIWLSLVTLAFIIVIIIVACCRCQSCCCGQDIIESIRGGSSGGGAGGGAGNNNAQRWRHSLKSSSKQSATAAASNGTSKLRRNQSVGSEGGGVDNGIYSNDSELIYPGSPPKEGKTSF